MRVAPGCEGTMSVCLRPNPQQDVVKIHPRLHRRETTVKSQLEGPEGSPLLLQPVDLLIVRLPEGLCAR